MLTKSILTAAAIALAAGIGSASAAEQFETLGTDVQAVAHPLTPSEAGRVFGADIFYISGNGVTKEYTGHFLSLLEHGSHAIFND